MLSHREYLERNAAWRGDQPALHVVETGETLSYRAFDERVNRFGNALADRGVRKGDRVVMVMFNTVEFPVVLYGCYKIGAVPVPVNYMLAVDDFRYIVEDVNPTTVVYDAAVASAVERATDEAVRPPERICVGDAAAAAPFDEVLASGATSAPKEYPLLPDEPAYILYTSGTTGDPKGVVLSAETADRRATEMAATVNLTQRSVALQLSPWFHAGGIDNTVQPSVTGGGQLLVFDEFEPVPALDAIERYGVTHISSVPTLTSRIADVDGVAERDLSSVECWINMGSPLSRVTAERFIETLTPNIFNNYGTTESLTDTVLRPDDLPEHAGTAGRPTIDTQVRVVELGTGRRVDPDETVPVGEKGQVVVRGASVFDCYYGNTAATKRAFTDGWFYTKDIGHKDEAGYLTITGRADDMILSGGELVSPFEVEDALEEHEGVEAAIVVGQPDEEWGERVRAYVVADGVTEDDLVAFCRAHDGLADYKRPRVWTFTDELERTATGKKQRFKYRED